MQDNKQKAVSRVCFPTCCKLKICGYNSLIFFTLNQAGTRIENLETSASPAGFARFDNQNGGQVEMGNAAPISIIETGVSFKDLRRDSKENDDSTDKQGKIRLQYKYCIYKFYRSDNMLLFKVT